MRIVPVVSQRKLLIHNSLLFVFDSFSYGGPCFSNRSGNVYRSFLRSPLQASLASIGGPFGDFSSASVFSFTAGIVRMRGKDLDLRS